MRTLKCIWWILLTAICLCVIMYSHNAGYKRGYEKGYTDYEPKEVIKYIEAANEERELELISLGMFETSAYDLDFECCGKLPTDPSYGKTATGTRATAGRTVAVDPNIVPYGTEVILGGKTYIAEDTGSAIKGKKIDIYFNSHSEAEQYGRRKVEVFVLR